MKFKDLKVGDNNIELYALVLDCKLKQTVNQTPYYGLSITDGTDTADARIWSVNITSNLENQTITAGEVYHLTVRVNDYAGKNQIIITKIENATKEEVDWSIFYKTAPVSEESLKTSIKEFINEISNPILKKIVVELIGNNAERYFKHQAAITMHHNYQGGLAYHILSMLKLAKQLIESYEGLNKDLLYSGILVHDIGKIVEITADKTPTYSKEGNLLGHIVVGVTMVQQAIDKYNFNGTEEAVALLHLMSAHHGELEYGSPKEPLIAEALALYLIDLMDSKLAGTLEFVMKAEKGTYTSPIPTLNKKSLYVPDIK